MRFSGANASFASSAEDLAMAEITRLSVGTAIDKLRGADAPASRIEHLDEKIHAVDEETQRLRATRLSLARSQGAASAGHDAQAPHQARITKLTMTGIVIGLVIAICILVWACWRLWA
jgi:hypothetical protein